MESYKAPVVSPKLAMLMKQKGYDIGTTSCYVVVDDKAYLNTSWWYDNSDSEDNQHELYCAPTVYEVLYYMRKKNVMVIVESFFTGKDVVYKYRIEENAPNGEDFSIKCYNNYKTYEEALEEALLKYFNFIEKW